MGKKKKKGGRYLLPLIIVIAAFSLAYAGTIVEKSKMEFAARYGPQVTVHSANNSENDAYVVMDGNTEDFYIGIDDSADDLIVGIGAVVGTTPLITISDTGANVATVKLTGQLLDAEVHTATSTLTIADCGKVHFLSHATVAIILTLPTPTLGCQMKFVTALAFSDQHEVRTVSGASNLIQGTLLVNAADVSCTVEDSLEFADTAETLGDYVEIISDGTSWFIQDSRAANAAAIACTT